MSSTAPTMKDLYQYKQDSGTVDFASFVRDVFHAKLVDSDVFGYRELLALTPEEERFLLSRTPVKWQEDAL